MLCPSLGQSRPPITLKRICWRLCTAQGHRVCPKPSRADLRIWKSSVTVATVNSPCPLLPASRKRSLWEATRRVYCPAVRLLSRRPWNIQVLSPLPVALNSKPVRPRRTVCPATRVLSVPTGHCDVSWQVSEVPRFHSLVSRPSCMRPFWPGPRKPTQETNTSGWKVQGPSR